MFSVAPDVQNTSNGSGEFYIEKKIYCKEQRKLVWIRVVSFQYDGKLISKKAAKESVQKIARFLNQEVCLGKFDIFKIGQKESNV